MCTCPRRSPKRRQLRNTARISGRAGIGKHHSTCGALHTTFNEALLRNGDEPAAKLEAATLHPPPLCGWTGRPPNLVLHEDTLCDAATPNGSEGEKDPLKPGRKTWTLVMAPIMSKNAEGYMMGLRKKPEHATKMIKNKYTSSRWCRQSLLEESQKNSCRRAMKHQTTGASPLDPEGA